MARLNSRRSRTVDFDDEDFSRGSTPISTASNDRKRMRPSSQVGSTSPEPEVHVRSRKQAASSIKNGGENTIRRRHHQPGSIVRVKLTNFVTYTSAEFFPGPSLNMVIGPNGTGKSTLVCAICLGLGWGPQLLGRAGKASEFVKHGCKEATIEIELQRAESGPNKSRRNPIITRKIRKDDNAAKFWINGSASTNRAVTSLMGSFNIQVDNLCQFLPQDRVVEFAQMTPVQMLETTLQAAAEPAVLERHEHLKELRAEQQEFMYNSKGDRELLESLQKRQDAQHVEVERLRERMTTQKLVEHLEKCRLVVKYNEMKKHVGELKKIKDRLEIETRQLEEATEPALEKINAKQQYAAATKSNRDHHAREVKRAEGECNRIEREINAANESMNDCEGRVKAEREGAKRDKANLGKYNSDLRALQVRKQHPPEAFDSRAMNEQIQQHNHRIRELEQEMDNIESEMRAEADKGKALQMQKKRAQKSLDDLNTQQGRQEALLEVMSKDAAKAWEWIKENQSKFRKEVFGPPAVTCSVKDPQMASAIESLFQVNDFKIFTVQCREDFVTLQEELLRKHKLHDISLRTCNLNDLSSLKKPMSDEHLRELGLVSWAIDCLEGPPTVLATLCQERFLHQVGISSRDVTSEQHDRISKSPIKSYVAGQKSVRFTRRAEYGDAGVSARTSELKQARVWTDQPVDAAQKQRIGDEIRQLNRHIHEQSERVETLRERGKELAAESDHHAAEARKLKADKEAKQKVQTEYNGLDAKIDQMQRKLDTATANIESFRERQAQIYAERDTAMFQKAAAVVKYCEAAHALKEASAKLLEAEFMVIEAQSDWENLRDRSKDIQDALTTKKVELAAATQNWIDRKTEGKKCGAAVLELKHQAEELSKRGEGDLLNLLLQLAGDKDQTEQSVQDRIESLQSQLELLTGGLADANTIREFEERAKKIEKLQSKMQEIDNKQRDYINSISTIRAKFEEALDPIIAQIDRAFGESFVRIGCAGQVAVFKASSDDPVDCTELMGGKDNGLDFANWAIHISVKFRESEPLSLLDSHRQSGGERAVSTIFYLMALQSLSKSPFRVVDEINQGMDPRNERMVHGRMVDIAAENENENGSQYFLITPKLLSGLKYERGMTVLCIVSGENMPSATEVRVRGENGRVHVEQGRKVDFAAFARRAREIGIANGGGRRMNTGVGMRSVDVYAQTV